MKPHVEAFFDSAKHTYSYVVSDPTIRSRVEMNSAMKQPLQSNELITSMCIMGTSEADFVAMRQARNATFGTPTLIHPSVQVNMRAGQLPPF